MRYAAMTLPVVLLALPLAGPAMTHGSSQERCDVRRELDRQLEPGLTGVLIDAGAGSLVVTGADVEHVRVRAVLCASDEDMADDARLIAEPRRGAAWIEADLPDGGGFGRGYARMDLTIEMPRSLAADIKDSSGGITVHGIDAVRIDDNSGSIEVQDIEGAVEIDDGSGEIWVANAGSVEVADGSGEMEISGVRGDVLVTDDGSGEIDIREVSGNVRIQDDGSGSITVVGVGGDFTLEEDGSGSVHYSDVKGRVSLPPDR